MRTRIGLSVEVYDFERVGWELDNPPRLNLSASAALLLDLTHAADVALYLQTLADNAVALKREVEARAVEGARR